MVKLNPLFLIFFSGIIICLVVQGCNNVTDSTGKKANSDFVTISVDIDNVSNLSVFDIFSRIEVIPLKTEENSIIKEIEKIICFDSHFYILDKYQNAVFIFDSIGNFRMKIQRVGNGPGEYSLLYDININPYTNELELLNPRGELLIYSLDGEYKGSIAIPLRSTARFALLSRDTVVYYSRYEKNKLFYFSRSLNKIIKEEFEFPEVILRTPLISTHSSPFNQSGSETTFFQGFSNDIYKIDSLSVRLKLRWDFGERNFDYKELPLEKDIQFYADYLRSCNKAYCFNYYLENEHYILTRFMYDKLWNTLIYDKMKKKYMIIKRFRENIVPPAVPVFFNDGIVTFIDPMQVQILLNESVLEEPYRSIFTNLKPEDNPVLIKYYFKNTE